MCYTAKPGERSLENDAKRFLMNRKTGTWGLEKRITLEGAVAGTRFAWAGIGTATNGWSIPADKFEVGDILKQYLVKLEPCGGRDCSGMKPQRFCYQCQLPEQSGHCTCATAPLCVKCRQRMQALVSEAPVNALLDANGEVRICGPLAPLADGSGKVLVQFGFEKVVEQASPKSPCNLDDVTTPTTPSPPTSPSPRRRKLGPECLKLGLEH